MRIVSALKKWYELMGASSPCECSHVITEENEGKFQEEELLDEWEQKIYDKAKEIKEAIATGSKVKAFIIKTPRAGVNPGKGGKSAKRFFKQCCEYDKEAVTSNLELYKHYKTWMKSMGESPITSIALPRFLDPKKVNAIQMLIDNKHCRCFKGVKIKKQS